MDFGLDDLLQESEKLLIEVQEDNDLPYITRSLDQIRHLGEKLYLSGSSHRDVKAARLLGSKMSYELPQKLSQKLESLSKVESVERKNALSELDIQTFLRIERENILLNAVCMSKKMVHEEIEEICDQSMQNWWKQQASSVLSALVGTGNPLNTEVCLDSMNPENLIDISYNCKPSVQLTYNEMVYSRQLDEYFNVHFNSLHKDDLFEYLSTFCESDCNLRNRSFTNNMDLEIVEIWRLMRMIGGTVKSTHNSFHKNQALEFRTSSSLQKSLLLCSLSYLESEFVQFLRVSVASQPRLARLGGRPDTRSLIRAYLSLHVDGNNINMDEGFNLRHVTDGFKFEHEDGCIDTKPVWAMIYYCLRSGDTQAAIEISREAMNNLNNFAQILEEYVNNNRRLLANTQSCFHRSYKQIIKTTKDPYKRWKTVDRVFQLYDFADCRRENLQRLVETSVYSIIGNFDFNDNHSEVVSNIDDFLWVKISQVLAQNSETNTVPGYQESVNLSQLQTLLHDIYGETHFDSSSQPTLYFKIMCLTQQYEAALGFLSRFESLRCHAVHIALALRDIGLLILPCKIHSPLLSRDEFDPTGIRRLNLARLVMLYTRKFELTDPTMTLMYYYLLSDIPNTESKDVESSSNSSGIDKVLSVSGGSDLFKICVCELAFATRELDLLLGSIGSNGFRKSGAIDRFRNTPESRQDLIRYVAHEFECRGEIIQAVILYQLASSCGNPKPDLIVAVSLLNSVLVNSIFVTNPHSDVTYKGTSQLDKDMVMRIAVELANKVRACGLCAETAILNSSAEVQMSTSDTVWTVKTLFYLLDLVTFFELVQAERWQAALDFMDQLSLFPPSPSSVHVESCVSLFSSLPDLVRRALPSALFALIRCLLLQSEKHSVTSTRPQNSLKPAEVRSRARALIAFVGRIPYRLPSEIYARLTQLETEIV